MSNEATELVRGLDVRDVERNIIRLETELLAWKTLRAVKRCLEHDGKQGAVFAKEVIDRLLLEQRIEEGPIEPGTSNLRINHVTVCERIANAFENNVFTESEAATASGISEGAIEYHLRKGPFERVAPRRWARKLQ